MKMNKWTQVVSVKCYTKCKQIAGYVLIVG